MNAEIIAIGSELLTPFRQDTNSLYLTGKLNEMGVEVIFKTIVGDNPKRLVSAASLAIARANIIVFTGGLGPTEDDLTRESVAKALSLPLNANPQILSALEKRFAERGWKMSSNNVKQADVIAGATVLPNPNGTAPGQWICGKYDGQERIIILLPGPPSEMRGVFEVAFEWLRAKIPPQFTTTRVIKVTGIGESNCDARVAPIYKKHPEIQTTILAGPGELQLHLKARRETLEAGQTSVDRLVEEIEAELGDLVFSDNGDSLEQIVGYYLQMRGGTVAVAESCTGGLLAERITSVSGSSRYFLGGAIVYSNELKTKFADVAPELIASCGAVSREVAEALAEGIRQRCGATYGIGITGVAGPTGGTAEKPVGLVFHAVASAAGTTVAEKTFYGDRQRIRQFASQQALDMLRKMLM